jgi:hypothetical protein
MPYIRTLRWPQALTEDQRVAFAAIWKADCGSDLWSNDYYRAFAVMDEEQIAAVLVYVRLNSHRINFGRMTLIPYRGRGYADTLLMKLIMRFPKDILECQNINPFLTAGLERHGFQMIDQRTRTYRLKARQR